MARSWEYSRGRRTAMQISMWLIFGCTLGVAGLVSRQKNALHRIELERQPRRVGDLLIHVPVGWETGRASRDGKVYLKMAEPLRDSRLRQRVQISQEPLDGNSFTAEAYLLQETENRPLAIEPFRFRNVGDGVFATASPVDYEDGQPGLAPALLACVIVPPSHRAAAPIAVIVELTGLPVFGPSDRELVQQIADGIVLAPGTGTARGRVPATENPPSARLLRQPR